MHTTESVFLWFEVADFDAAVARAAELRAPVVLPRHRNPPDCDSGPNHWEIWLRDPDGTADGTWKPGPPSGR